MPPADGIVSSIADVSPPSELELGSAPFAASVGLYDLFNCHINRVPIGSQIVPVAYRKEAFINASLDKASAHNERNRMVIKWKNDIEVGVVQIAGLVARRILCFVKKGDCLQTGERLGLILFGSRLDDYLPETRTLHCPARSLCRRVRRQRCAAVVGPLARGVPRRGRRGRGRGPDRLPLTERGR